MKRIDDDILATHLEVALAIAPTVGLAGLENVDRSARSAAIARLASHLADRLRCFEIFDDDEDEKLEHPLLFPDA